MSYRLGGAAQGVERAASRRAYHPWIQEVRRAGDTELVDQPLPAHATIGLEHRPVHHLPGQR